MTDRAYDSTRLKDLIHYVIWKAGVRPNFGATKLYKVAWFADARRYVLSGKSITGARYVRQNHGPIPQEAWRIRDEMVKAGIITQQKDQGDYGGWRFKALVPPSSNVFSPEEKQEIDYWIKHIDEDHTATSISEQSHDYGWEIAKQGEALPFYSVLASRVREPNDEELTWAKETARQLGLI